MFSVGLYILCTGNIIFVVWSVLSTMTAGFTSLPSK